MKYRTFVALRAVVIVVVLVALGFVTYRALHGSSQAASGAAAVPVAAAPADAENAAAAPIAPAPATPSDPTVLTDAERQILQLQSSPLTNGVPDPKNGTRRWVVDQPGFHAEFRADLDKGDKYWDRVKIDWNGNGRFDEKWNFRADGTVARHVAPGDDENYTEQFRLNGDHWAPMTH